MLCALFLKLDARSGFYFWVYTYWQYGLRDLFRARPGNPFAGYNLRISVGHPDNKMLCIFLSKNKFERAL